MLSCAEDGGHDPQDFRPEPASNRARSPNASSSRVAVVGFEPTFVRLMRPCWNHSSHTAVPILRAPARNRTQVSSSVAMRRIRWTTKAKYPR